MNMKFKPTILKIIISLVIGFIVAYLFLSNIKGFFDGISVLSGIGVLDTLFFSLIVYIIWSFIQKKK